MMSQLSTQTTEGRSVGLGSARPTVTIPDADSNWQTLDRQKRQRSSPDLNPNKRLLPKYYWLGDSVPTSNRFENLPPSIMETTTEPTKRSYKPPIFVSGVANITPLLTALDSITKGKYTIKLLPKEEVKIQANESIEYDTIINLLRSKGTQFYTFKKKEDKPYTVILRNVHPQVDTDEIIQELSRYGHKVSRISNICHSIKKTPLPLFSIDLVPSEKDSTVKCCNCGGSHPANYKGCSLYKELQAKRFPKLREPTHHHILPPSSCPSTTPPRGYDDGRYPSLNPIIQPNNYLVSPVGDRW